MQRIKATTEREAYERYLEHLRAGECDCEPREGVLCPDGVVLHGLWRTAAEGEACSTSD